ncbi:hypothetical protein [Tropicimonas isoalkanivorans]|uniref:Uncharacterized protein n=1 Tax=Tropicimonas isoalkanivorans TaxID=441112 RepID=A0A1I1GKH4_9RHOB|nr:hypothetical protein [Tropicimonas isoalkanivorans]SFC11956.1 hypothetical protein SAMN04488094_102613 [Tropicimonas isoalkanivorans]
MPDLTAILAFYQAIAFFSVTGALPGEAAMMAQPEREAVVQRFLSPSERGNFDALSDVDRRVRLRKGETRFRAWESANPDVAAVLRRKAERLAFEPAPCV